jgi:class 3 adenylate cyclase
LAAISALGEVVRSFRNWGLRYKLLLVLLQLGITTFAVTGAISYIRHLHSLKQNAINQLTSIRRAKAYQIESYYRTIHNHVLTLSQDWMFVDAMREFRAAYAALNQKPVSQELRDAVVEDYRTHVYPQMQALKIARSKFEEYLPVTPAAFHLQYDYVVNNPFPADRRRDLQTVPGEGQYTGVHAKYHHVFQKIVETYGYHDIYLIENESQRVIYGVNKDRDLGTSLLVGPYRNNNLAKVVKQCVETDNPDSVFFSDFELDEAHLGEPTQWVASPIFDGKKPIGVLALQISTEHLEDVVTGRRGWQRDGLGQTGRSNIIGPDYLVRTNVRPFLENPGKFLSQLKADGVSAETMERIRALNSTILLAEIRRPSVAAALGGKEGWATERAAFGGNPSVVSYMPLRIETLHWVFESRMDTAEAFKPVTDMQHFFIWWGAVIFLLTVMTALLMTRLILRPVDALANAAQKVSAGDLTAKVDWKSEDELGMLCDTFNAMTKSIREKTALIEQKNRENEALLLNILPGEIADRLKGGESDIADSFADVTVLFGDLVGFTSLSARMSPDEIVDMLNGLFSRFDRVAIELGTEKIKTIGDCYMAVCGLPKPCSDHAERMARMALRMLQETREHGKEKGLGLQMRIGLNSGPVTAGVIGASKFIYDLWGDTVNLASRMESTGVPGEIQVTRSVYERLKDRFQMDCRGMVQVKGKGEIEAWLLHGEARTMPLAG